MRFRGNQVPHTIAVATTYPVIDNLAPGDFAVVTAAPVMYEFMCRLNDWAQQYQNAAEKAEGIQRFTLEAGDILDAIHNKYKENA